MSDPPIVAPKHDPTPQEAQQPVSLARAHPRELEWNAFDVEDDHMRGRLYLQAGNRYLDELQDVESALRCYQQAFHYCEARDLELDANDNWLVESLKRNRRKEP
jgi:hypothetical protein